jgi:hypothetical protein
MRDDSRSRERPRSPPPVGRKRFLAGRHRLEGHPRHDEEALASAGNPSEGEGRGPADAEGARDSITRGARREGTGDPAPAGCALEEESDVDEVHRGQDEYADGTSRQTPRMRPSRAHRHDCCNVRLIVALHVVDKGRPKPSRTRATSSYRLARAAFPARLPSATRTQSSHVFRCSSDTVIGVSVMGFGTGGSPAPPPRNRCRPVLVLARLPRLRRSFREGVRGVVGRRGGSGRAGGDAPPHSRVPTADIVA